jgi:hypothetical protein
MSKNSHALIVKPTNKKMENGMTQKNYIASVIVNKIETEGKIIQNTDDGPRPIDEYFIDAKMELLCKWHDTVTGAWKDTKINYEKTYKFSKGERVPRIHSPIVFKRTEDGGFVL